jgi:hypothetical protein
MKTRFYKYFFQGIDKPIIMEAEDRYIAYEMLKQLSFKSQTKIDMLKLEDMRVETPLIGISTKKRNGIDYTWVGKQYTSDGWLETNQYNEIQKLKNQKNGS